MTWLILEGIDGAGKTRLARALRDTYQWDYEHLDAESGAYVHLANNWRYYPKGRNVIWDRGHLGEFVYGPERGYLPDVGSLRLMEALAINHGAVQIWVKRSPRACADVATSRSYAELCLHESRYQELCSSRDLALRLAPMDSPDDLGQLVRRFSVLDEHARRQVGRCLDDEGVGTTKPRLWLLGEQQNPSAPVHVPFATRVGLTLVWPHVDPRYVRVSNALEREVSGRSLLERWVSLGEPEIVTLGRVARDACVEAELPVLHDFPHPNYWSRFFSTRADEWHEQLEAVLNSVTPPPAESLLGFVSGVVDLVSTVMSE